MRKENKILSLLQPAGLQLIELLRCFSVGLADEYSSLYHLSLNFAFVLR